MRGGCEEKQWVIVQSGRNSIMSVGQGDTSKRGSGVGRGRENIQWSLDRKERGEVGSGPQVGRWTDQEGGSFQLLDTGDEDEHCHNPG